MARDEQVAQAEAHDQATVRRPAQLGYDGFYNRVAAFARSWHEEYRRQQHISGRSTFVPLSFAAGEPFQFDWSEDWAIIAGVRTKLQVAHFQAQLQPRVRRQGLLAANA